MWKKLLDGVGNDDLNEKIKNASQQMLCHESQLNAGRTKYIFGTRERKQEVSPMFCRIAVEADTGAV